MGAVPFCMTRAQRFQKKQTESSSTPHAVRAPLLTLIADEPSYEKHLIAQVIARGPDARGAEDALYRKYRRAVSCIAASFGDLNSDEVDDVVQDTFVRAFRSMATLKEVSRFTAWLLTIARNRSLSELSIRGSRGKAATEANRESLLLADVPPSAPEMMEHSADLLVVRSAIDGLAEGSEKETIRLFYVDGALTAREIGHKLGVGKSAITMRLERFRKRIKSQIIDQCAR